MQHSVEICEADALCIWRFEGVLTADGLKHAYQEREKAPGFRYDLGVLVDLRNADLSQLGREGVSDYMQWAQAEQVRTGQYIMNCAILIDRQLDFPLTQFFVSIATNVVVTREKMFTEFADARAWLIAQNNSARPSGEVATSGRE